MLIYELGLPKTVSSTVWMKVKASKLAFSQTSWRCTCKTAQIAAATSIGFIKTFEEKHVSLFPLQEQHKLTFYKMEEIGHY
jgi:hypothetical protein